MVPAPALGDETISDISLGDSFTKEATYAGTLIEGDYYYTLESYSSPGENYEGAIIVAYTGNSRDVEIPSYLGGSPVIGLSESVFQNNQNIDSVTIPEGVTSIGRSPFANSSVKTINLPSTWDGSYSGPGYLSLSDGCSQLTAINVSSDNPWFCTIDGNLYNKDATELISYAGGKSDTTFTLPSTVTSISNYPFTGSAYLQTLNIPDSVMSATYIGGPSIQTINIGKNVSTISSDAFGNGLTQINVDPENSSFSSQDGILYNKDKTSIVAYPANKAGERFIVPESVTSIGSYPFDEVLNLKEIIFPSKIVYAESYPFGPFSNNSLKRVIFRNSIASNLHFYNGRDRYNITFIGDDLVRQAFGDGSYLNPDLSQISFSFHNQYYTGSPIAPEMLFNDYLTKENFSHLTEGVNYTTIYEDNINPGQATVTITGIGDFCGSTSATFDIIGTGYNGSNSSGSNGSTSGNGGATSNPTKNPGWVQDSNGWWYKNADGSYPANKWVQIGSAWYYFNKSGYMQTGWQKIGGAWYYLNDSGVMQTGWQQIDGGWYYFNGSGAMQTGWLQTGGKWYYLKSSGVMATGWVNVGGTWYYMNTSGVMQTGWQQIDGNWYYLKSSGAMATGWYQVGSKWYYSNSSGVMQTNRWVGNYWVGESGAMATNATVDGGRYRVGADGLWVK